MQNSKNTTIRPAAEADCEQWLRCRLSLWPGTSRYEHVQEIQDYLNNQNLLALVAENAQGQLVGFLEAGLRFYAEGCASHNVGYIEGWYVDAAYRRQGIGAMLIQEAEQWAQSRGCREMASDCLITNDVSLAAHLALGYEEKERLIHFVKTL